jgi:hypothetical protein
METNQPDSTVSTISTVSCPKYGKPAKETALFCGHCGAALSASSEEVPKELANPAPPINDVPAS